MPVRIPNDPTLSGRTLWTAGLRPGGPGELLRATNVVPIGIAK